MEVKKIKKKNGALFSKKEIKGGQKTHLHVQLRVQLGCGGGKGKAGRGVRRGRGVGKGNRRNKKQNLAHPGS